MKVMKFGGTCVANSAMITKVEEVIEKEKEDKVITLSAVAGITNQLIDFISSFHKDEEIDAFVEELRKNHVKLLPEGNEQLLKEATEALDTRLRKLSSLLYGVSYTEEITPRTRDMIISMGERLSVVILASRLKARGINASNFNSDEIGIITDGVHGNATADMNECEKSVGPKIHALLKAGVTPVVTGFFGISKNGHVTTFGRSGTDYSASVLARSCNASVVEIWKDVDGFMTADPKMVPEAKQVDRLSYEEAAELAYFGAQVLHPRAVFPVLQKKIPIAVRNVTRPDDPGTIICNDTSTKKSILKSVSFLKKIATIKVFGTGAGYKEGFLADITQALAEANVNIYSATTSQTCVAMLLEEGDVHMAKKTLEHILGGYYERIEIHENSALVCVVGAGLGSTRGVAARVFNAIANQGVNIDLISAGASTVAYHFTVDKKDVQKTIRAIHNEFFTG
ncbi:MAG: aspartate kinase [Thermoplasmata archaeon]|nr:aspartate kinase [Thermoplasmata archaeon]